MANFQIISAASFWPGLQNVGTTYGTANITGTLNPTPNPANLATSSNLTGVIFVSLPDPQVISALRINLPDANGDLAAKWFPVFGTTELTDDTANWRLILYVGSAPAGRLIYFNFVNLANSTTSINQRLNIYGHLYTYPF